MGTGRGNTSLPGESQNWKNVREWAWYIRKGTSTVMAKDEDERELMSLAASVPFDHRYQQTAQISDLSPHLIREYLTEIGSDLVFDAGQLDSEALGRRMNIVGGPKEVSFPKNVGLMFFNKSPSRFSPRHKSMWSNFRTVREEIILRRKSFWDHWET